MTAIFLPSLHKSSVNFVTGSSIKATVSLGSGCRRKKKKENSGNFLGGHSKSVIRDCHFPWALLSISLT